MKNRIHCKKNKEQVKENKLNRHNAYDKSKKNAWNSINNKP